MTVNGDGSFSVTNSAEVGNSGVDMIDRETASFFGSKNDLILRLQFAEVVKFAGIGDAGFEGGFIAKKPASKPKADRTNKKAEVIAMMKRAKGATLAEIMKATSWQPHTVRGFVSILGSKGGEKVESSKNAAGERTYKIGK